MPTQAHSVALHGGSPVKAIRLYISIESVYTVFCGLGGDISEPFRFVALST